MHNKKNVHGFLIHTVEKYAGCLGEVDNLSFDYLFQENLAYWETISKGTLKNQHCFREKIDTFLKSQADSLEEILFANTLAIASPTLRKLPILSTVHKNGKLDFEWPTELEMKEMLKKQMVKIVKIELWYYSEYNFLTGVRATLSNGEQSPIFKTTGEQNGPITLHIDQNKRVRTLAIRSHEDGVYGLKVTDKHKKDIVEWSGDVTQDWKEQEIPNGETITGIYGLNGYGGNGIQNFGFITLSYY